jgi:hypothetical protein
MEREMQSDGGQAALARRPDRRPVDAPAAEHTAGRGRGIGDIVGFVGGSALVRGDLRLGDTAIGDVSAARG